ncbi:MAG: ComF family protein [Balneolaceae bacterium]|nr:ComF family protein [Balneolaceae bacterium]
MNRTWLRGPAAVLFPDICVCCWREPVSRRQPVCPFCLEDRFEEADPDVARGTVGDFLPEGVILRYALWKYDKGGSLQELLYRVKYGGMEGVACQFGERLAHRLRPHSVLRRLNPSRLLLLPVPLHPARLRLRGYNQAERIARGMQRTWALPVADPETVRRTRNTRSQTGMTLPERISNLEQAFDVRRPELLRGRTVLLVDDVFTTGATAFSLSTCLLKAGARQTAVVTVARA